MRTVKRKRKVAAKPRRRRTWAPLPRSRAKTAYQLLDEVKKVIIEEPKRYDQGDFGVDYRNTWEPGERPDLPICGTVACVAGWMVVLRGGSLNDTTTGVSERAEQLMGYDIDTSHLFGGGVVSGESGGKTHAQNGVKHITAFQKAHAKELKARILPPMKKKGARARK